MTIFVANITSALAAFSIQLGPDDLVDVKVCPNICCFVYYDRLKQDSDSRGCRNRAYLYLSIKFNDEIESSYLLSDNSY